MGLGDDIAAGLRFVRGKNGKGAQSRPHHHAN
jgi:hypothetical protein